MSICGPVRRRVILEIPEAWFANPSDGDRHRLFYTSLLAALAELGLLIDPIWLPRGAERAPRPTNPSDLIISFHSYGEASGNLLRCKETYIPPFYSLDPMGYSCFSQLATQPELYLMRLPQRSKETPLASERTWHWICAATIGRNTLSPICQKAFSRAVMSLYPCKCRTIQLPRELGSTSPRRCAR